jgi:hypothetical protein
MGGLGGGGSSGLRGVLHFLRFLRQPPQRRLVTALAATYRFGTVAPVDEQGGAAVHHGVDVAVASAYHAAFRHDGAPALVSHDTTDCPEVIRAGIPTPSPGAGRRSDGHR